MLVLLFSNFTISCLFKNIRDSGNYIAKEKFTDPEYVLQENIMEKCIKDLLPPLPERLETIKRIFINSAVFTVKLNLKAADHATFDKRGYIKCIEIIAAHKANLVICKKFLGIYFDYDIIKKYAILEYEECLRQKNKLYIRELKFSMPVHFPENNGLDVEEM
ncbi:hypothetical protein BDAP_002464 [Binucleata daphniae]